MFKITVSTLDQKKLQKIILKKTSASSKGSLTKNVRSAIEDEIVEAIAGKGGNGKTDVAQSFMPHETSGGEDLVGRLGPGKNHTPDFYRLNNAWRQLLPIGPFSGPATVNGSFSIKAGKSGKLGQFTYSLDIDELFSTRLSTFGYFNRKKGGGENGALVIVPWLQHFIEGISIEGYGFTKKSHKLLKSRTGIGIMIKIPRGSFKIPPNPEPMAKLRDAITDKFRSKNFKKKLGKIITGRT